MSPIWGTQYCLTVCNNSVIVRDNQYVCFQLIKLRFRDIIRTRSQMVTVMGLS